MADPAPAGRDVSAGTYKCTNCGYRLQVGSIKHLPPCPSCKNGYWEALTGGDSVDDPYPIGTIGDSEPSGDQLSSGPEHRRVRWRRQKRRYLLVEYGRERFR